MTTRLPPDGRWPAPAKLNLFLHITGRRADGYHLLQTVFQFIDYCDWLSFRVRQDGEIFHSNPLPGVAPEQDLTVRAARLLQQQTGCPLGVDIQIDKHLPMGGGLGGGSSDAATTLVALNALWNLELSLDRLAELGLSLGADVPVFVRGEAAWAEGVGERLTPVDLPEPWYVVLMPDAQVSTAALFTHPDLTRDAVPLKIRRFPAGAGVNVFEPLVAKQFPAVAMALEWLSQYGPARMTGTGACVFAPFETEQRAHKVMSLLPNGWRGVMAKGLNRSPLHRYRPR